MTRSVVIADASSLIALYNIGEIDVLARIFPTITITPEVALEYGIELPDWIHIQAASERSMLRREIVSLDLGEASSIALALESQNPLLIIDEKKGRRIAEKLNIEIIGVVGILIKARLEGYIENPENLLARLESVDFRLDNALKARLLGSNERIH